MVLNFPRQYQVTSAKQNLGKTQGGWNSSNIIALFTTCTVLDPSMQIKKASGGEPQ